MISVLYVDDEPDLLDIARIFLEQTGEFNVETSISATAILDDAAIPTYDAIVSDYQMPGMDGIAFLKEVRKRYGDIPFILFTGRGREEVVIEAINNGADFYLQKGGDPTTQFAELAHQIRQTVRRKKAERELFRSEERYRSVVNDQTELIARFTPDGIITFVNEAYRAYFAPRLDLSGVVGKNIREMMQVKNYAEVETFLGSLTRQNPIREMERCFTGKDQNPHRQIWSGRALFGEGDTPAEYQVVGQDITGKKRVEEELRRKNDELNASCEQIAATEEELRGQLDEITRQQAALKRSEERFRAFTENIPYFTTISDISGSYTYVSPSLLRITGRTREELIGKDTFAIVDLFGIHRDDVEKIRKLGRQAIAQPGVPVTIPPFRGLDKEGRTHYHEGTATYLPDVEGIRGIIFHGRDITDRIEAEEALKKSEERFRSMAGLPADMLFLFDKDMCLTYVSPQVRAIVGYDPDELRGKTADFTKNTLFFEDSRAFDDALKRGMAGETLDDLSLKIKRKDGSFASVVVHAVPVMDNGIFSGMQIYMRDISATENSEGSLSESENTFRTIFENSPYPIAINSVPGARFLAINKAFVAASGFEEEEVIGKTHLDLGLISLADSARLIARFVAAGKIENMPLVLTAKAGRRVHVLFSTIPITFNNRSAVLTITAEVTRLRRIEEELIQKNEELNAANEQLLATEEELRVKYDELEAKERTIRESGEKFRALVENTLDGILIIDFAGNILFVNRAGGRLVDLERYEEIAGKRNVMEFVAPESREDVLHDFETVARGTDSFVALYHIITETKRQIWLESIGKKIPFENSVAILLSIRDITERKRAEDALQESRRMLAEAMDLAHLVNWEFDVATGIFTFDDRFYAMYGTTAQREGGPQMTAERYAEEFVHFEDRHLVAGEVEKAIKATSPDYVSQLEHRIVRRDGAVRHIVVRFGITKDAAGRTVKTHGANQDITDRKRAEEALHTANHQLNLLTGITRHDILNKVSVILGYLTIAEKNCDSPKMDTLLRNMRSATAAIQSQIEFPLVYQDLGTQEPQWLELDSILPYSYVPVTIAMNADLKGIRVYADPMLEKVFFNLLDNSIRHGQHVTEITLSSFNSSGDLLVVWEDNGIGIPAEEKDVIFDRGFGKNTGLGLFLVREVLALTGIMITECGVPGKGARFEIMVPKESYRLDPDRWLPRAARGG
jgi:PAS domain S-box-containing protein